MYCSFLILSFNSSIIANETITNHSKTESNMVFTWDLEVNIFLTKFFISDY